MKLPNIAITADKARPKVELHRRHSSVTTPTKDEIKNINNTAASPLLSDDIAIDYSKLSPSRSYMRLDNEDNDIATNGGGTQDDHMSMGCSRSIIVVTQSNKKPTLLTRSQSTPNNSTTTPTNTFTTKTIGTINNTLTLKTFDTNTSTPKRSTEISEAFIKINNMASQIKHSQKLIEEQKNIDRNELWNVVKRIDNGATSTKMVDGGNNVEGNKLDTTAETTPLNNEEGGEGAPSLEWTVDWNLCNTSNNFSANPCGVSPCDGSAANCTPSTTFCGAKECWENAYFPDNDVFACNDFFDLNAATTKADINNASTTTTNQDDKKNGVVIAEEYNEVIEINDKVAADISSGKDVDGSMSQSLAVVEWLKDEYMASIGASEIDTTSNEQENKGKKDLPSSPTSVLDCAQLSLADVTSSISSFAEIPKSMCKHEDIVSSTVACCGVFDSIVQIPQSFNDVVTCQLFPESNTDDVDESLKSGSGGDNKVASSKVKSNEVNGLCENIDQVFISEDDEDVIVDDDNSQPSI